MSLSTIRSSLFLVLLVGKPNFTLTRSFIFVHSLRLFLSTSSASGFLFARKKQYRPSDSTVYWVVYFACWVVGMGLLPLCLVLETADRLDDFLLLLGINPQPRQRLSCVAVRADEGDVVHSGHCGVFTCTRHFRVFLCDRLVWIRVGPPAPPGGWSQQSRGTPGRRNAPPAGPWQRRSPPPPGCWQSPSPAPGTSGPGS